MEPEGTYLLWLDFSSYSLTDRELRDTLIHKESGSKSRN